MKRRAAIVTISLAINSVIGSHAYAVDGCALALCLVKGGSAFDECKPILKEFFKDTALGKPPPRCKKMGGGNNSGSATSNEQYTQATNGASAVAAGSPEANPYGDAMSDQYAAAQTSSVEAAASAAVAVNAGARTVDASDVLTSDAGSTAVDTSSDVTATATEQVASGTGDCLDTDDSCTFIANITDVDPDIAAEAQAELDAQSLADTTL